MDAHLGVIAMAGAKRDDLLANQGLSLARGSTLRVEDGRGTLVRVRGGCVWITQEGELRDEILDPGRPFRISRDGFTLITAVEESLVAFEYPRGESLPRCVELSSPEGARLVIARGSGLRDRLARFGARLTEIWLGFYATRPRRVAPFI